MPSAKHLELCDRQANRPENKFTCVLLGADDAYLAQAAESFAGTWFDVRHSSRYGRREKKLTPDAYAATGSGAVDFLFSFLCPVIIPEPLLRAARIAPINFHPAPPRYPGVGSASYAIYQEDAAFGVTAHVMAPVVDSGMIIRTLEFPISQGDTCETLFNRAKNYSLFLFYEVLAELAGTGKVVGSGEKWLGKAITRKDFEKWMTVSPEDPAKEIERKIRALRHSRFFAPYVKYACK